jgi:hypothetical protein
MKTITVKNLNESTAQEVFDFVVNHLLTQNKKAQQGAGGCKYRLSLEDGSVLRCAAGCLIPDELYDERIEGRLWNGMDGVGNENPARRYGAMEHQGLIRSLQYIHDEYTPEQWRDRLEQEAKNYFLTFNF